MSLPGSPRLQLGVAALLIVAALFLIAATPPTSLPVPGGTAQTLPIGQQTMANGVNVTVASDQSPIPARGCAPTVQIVPTITAGAYGQYKVWGGVIHLSGILPLVSSGVYQGVLNSIGLKFKASSQLGGFHVVVFSANPTNGTYTDNASPTYNSADQQYQVASYNMGSGSSDLGTQTIYNLDGISHSIQNTTGDLWLVILNQTATANNPASTSDMLVEVGVLL